MLNFLKTWISSIKSSKTFKMIMIIIFMSGLSNLGQSQVEGPVIACHQYCGSGMNCQCYLWSIMWGRCGYTGYTTDFCQQP